MAGDEYGFLHNTNYIPITLLTSCGCSAALDTAILGIFGTTKVSSGSTAPTGADLLDIYNDQKVTDDVHYAGDAYTNWNAIYNSTIWGTAATAAQTYIGVANDYKSYAIAVNNELNGQWCIGSTTMSTCASHILNDNATSQGWVIAQSANAKLSQTLAGTVIASNLTNEIQMATDIWSNACANGAGQVPEAAKCNGSSSNKSAGSTFESDLKHYVSNINTYTQTVASTASNY